jgi:hypothetical protein
MSKLKEKLEDLTKQYKEVAEQASQANTMKIKLEGAMEMTQMLLNEEAEEAEETQEVKQKKSKGS